MNAQLAKELAENANEPLIEAAILEAKRLLPSILTSIEEAAKRGRTSYEYIQNKDMYDCRLLSAVCDVLAPLGFRTKFALPGITICW